MTDTDGVRDLFDGLAFAGLERLHSGGGITVESDVAFTRAHKPGTDDY